MTAYAELQVTTNFSFLRGASDAVDLVLAGEGDESVALRLGPTGVAGRF